MPADDNDAVAWVSKHVLPLEGELRGWLLNHHISASEADDIMQEVYCRLLEHQDLRQIVQPRAYIYRMMRNSLVDRFRERTIVDIMAVQSLDELSIPDNASSPEDVVLMRSEMRWVLSLIGSLPERCKRVFELRKVYGLSQAETAERLRLTENIIEKETARGLRLMSNIIKNGTSPVSASNKAGDPDRKAKVAKKRRHKSELQ